MKWIFSVGYNKEIAQVWLLALRAGVCALMWTHGIPKFLRLLEGNMKFGDPIGLGPTASFLLINFSEVFCSLLILLGLATRLATIPLIISCSVAAFIVHAEDPFARQEVLLLYILIYITLLVMGPGKYSIDALINPPQHRRRR